MTKDMINLIKSCASSMTSCKSTKSNFRFNHPKFCGMTLCIGMLGTESRTKCIDIAKRHLPYTRLPTGPIPSMMLVFGKSLVYSRCFPVRFWGGCSNSNVVTRNISPAPSQSLPVIMGYEHIKIHVFEKIDELQRRRQNERGTQRYIGIGTRTQMGNGTQIF